MQLYMRILLDQNGSTICSSTCLLGLNLYRGRGPTSGAKLKIHCLAVCFSMSVVGLNCNEMLLFVLFSGEFV